MERTIPMKPQYQVTRLRHLGRIIFKGLPSFQCFPHFLHGNIALKHALNGMHAEEDFGIFHWKVILLHDAHKNLNTRNI